MQRDARSRAQQQEDAGKVLLVMREILGDEKRFGNRFELRYGFLRPREERGVVDDRRMSFRNIDGAGATLRIGDFSSDVLDGGLQCLALLKGKRAQASLDDARGRDGVSKIDARHMAELQEAVLR